MKKMIMLLIIATLFTGLYTDNKSIIQTPNIIAATHSTLNPTFSHEGGFYDANFLLSLTAKPNTIIYYTLDGSEPTYSSAIYYEPLSIEKMVIETDWEEIRIQNQLEPFDDIPVPSYPISYIRTSSDKWKKPSGEIFKATILKVKAIDNLGNSSPVITQTYFVDEDMENRYSFPIISITADLMDLYGYETGINIPGIHYDPTIPEERSQNRTGNYYERGDEWEKLAHIEFFEKDGNKAFSQDVGLRVHGGLSRKYAVKSYRLYARSDYGEDNRFNYQFFEDKDQDEFKRILLRGGGQTYEYTLMGEAAAQSLLKPLSLDIQYSTPVIVFINGEYFGIRNIRDRFDDWYLQLTYDVKREDVTILTGNGYFQDGDQNGSTHYNNLYNFVTKRDMSKNDLYKYVGTQMDIENFIDYYASQIYLANVDWPQNNILYWRYNKPYNANADYGKDGRWRWMIYDVDASFGASWGGYFPEFNSMERLTGENWKKGSMFTSLLKNPTFKTQFINRTLDLLNTIFEGEQASEQVRDLINLYAPEMPEHIARYGYPSNYNSWIFYTNRMVNFAENRPIYLREHLQEYFGLSDEMYTLSLFSNEEQGKIIANTISVGQSLDDIASPWSGIYFKDVPLTLRAQSNTGYRFIGWYDLNHQLISTQRTYQFSLNEDTYIEARYEVGVEPPELVSLKSETILFIGSISAMGTILAIAYIVERKKSRI